MSAYRLWLFVRLAEPLRVELRGSDDARTFLATAAEAARDDFRGHHD